MHIKFTVGLGPPRTSVPTDSQYKFIENPIQLPS